MLQLADFPLLPKITHLRSQLLQHGRAGEPTKLAVLVALLADPATGPKTLQALAWATQYSAKRVVNSVEQLLRVNLIAAVPWTNDTFAFHVPNRETYVWAPTSTLEQLSADLQLLRQLVKDVRRRARARPQRDEDLVREPVVVLNEEAAEVLDVPPNLASTIDPMLTTPLTHEDTHPATQPADPPPVESSRVQCRFEEITKQYKHALSTKQHLDRLEQNSADDKEEFEQLRREVLSEPFGNLQSMLHETGHVIAETLGTSMCPITTPCSVCFEMMYGAHAFPNCGHTFCESCVYRLPWTQRSDDDVYFVGKECPMCRNVSVPIMLYL